MLGWLLELRRSFRGLAQDRSFTVAALLTLVLGVGVTAAAFSVVDAVLLQPLPFREPERLVRTFATYRGELATRGSLSVPDIMDLDEQAQEIESFGGYVRWNFNLATTGAADAAPGRIWGSLVTAGFLPTLGVEPTLGRLFTAEEDVPGAAKVVLLGHGLWQTRFQGDPTVLGRTVRLDHVDHEIVGILPPGFQYPNDAEVWVPHAGARSEALRGMRALRTVGRLRSGASLASAQEELAALAERMANDHPRTNRELGFALVPLRDHIQGKAVSTLWGLFAATGLVWLVACGNVASLMLARLQRRLGAFSVRRALGSTRGQLFGLLLGEALLLALAAGVLSLAPAALLVRGVVGILRSQQNLSFLAEGVHDVARLELAGIDLRVVAFTLLSSLLAAVVIGGLPLLRLSESRLRGLLSETAPSALSRRRGLLLERMLVGGQVAAAVCLVVVAALLGRSLGALAAEPPGFEPRGVLTMQISAPMERYRAGAQAAELFQRLLGGVLALPGVQAAGLTFGLPMSDLGGTLPFQLETAPAPADAEPQEAVLQPVAGRYFEAIGLPVAEGRAFDERDVRSAPAVAMVNQAWVARFSPGQSPIGHRVAFEGVFGPVGSVPKASRQIVGVVADAQTLGLGKGTRPEIYVPLDQITWRHLSLAVRTATAPQGLAKQVQKVLSGLDADLAIGHVRSLEEVVGQSTAPSRVKTVLAAMLAAVSLVLALIGLSGLVANTVAARQRELGLRMACGAEPGVVVRQVLRENLPLVLTGIVAGLGLAVLAARALRAWLHGVQPADLPTLLGVAVVFAAVTLLATLLPARRITRIDPARALQPLSSGSLATAKGGPR